MKRMFSLNKPHFMTTFIRYEYLMQYLKLAVKILSRWMKRKTRTGKQVIKQKDFIDTLKQACCSYAHSLYVANIRFIISDSNYPVILNFNLSVILNKIYNHIRNIYSFPIILLHYGNSKLLKVEFHQIQGWSLSQSKDLVTSVLECHSAQECCYTVDLR